MNNIMKWIRDKDFFAVPVQFSYKNKRAFNTHVGGCLSIVLVLAFVSYFTVMMFELI